jgi:hypothetical protein
MLRFVMARAAVVERIPVVLALAWGVACGTSSSTLAPTPVASATPTPAPTPAPAGSPSPSPANALPTGAFRIEPPAGPDHVVSISVGDTIHIHGSGFDAPAGETLTLFADWGDGHRGRDYCGPCRVQHAYAAAGVFTLAATIQDESGGVQRTWRVQVQ